MFDDSVMRRFIWGTSTGPITVANILGFDVDWERYAGWQNLFPRARKILLMPRFDWLPGTKSTVRTTGSPAYWLQKATDLFPRDFELMANALWRLEYDLMAPSFSVRDEIEWRIRRLKLQILELGYRPVPDTTVPAKVKLRLARLLKPYLHGQEAK
jgi:hypothetical protein